MQNNIRRMQETDLDSVLSIEKVSYPVPWTRGIFSDCLRVGYPSWVLLDYDTIIGYVLFSVGADEAHLLNICIAPDMRRQGLAKNFLIELFGLLKNKGIISLFLEVRKSNSHAISMYESMGFKRIGTRKDYYKSVDGQEDALTYQFAL
jgi:ribosomal-protein-alanine N-acetyltransferase